MNLIPDCTAPTPRWVRGSPATNLIKPYIKVRNRLAGGGNSHHFRDVPGKCRLLSKLRYGVTISFDGDAICWGTIRNEGTDGACAETLQAA